ncbi:hypothetical protein OEZ85_002118 [Tetradesmus obliquus]|uniref:Methyltransferase FkbM domain-containing protein n=1 Tax=Tetradesmus obliquus TaxID=3088 RepID=A0ABY8U200_TETOB|nr:hypothetical protein OEZ85_002118 [Tetradesmus obliquus]
MARKPDVRSDKTRSWAFRGRGTGFTLVLSLLLVLFGYVLYLSAARGSSSSSSSSSSDGSGGRCSLSTADLLDAAAAAKLDSLGMRQLMQLQQGLFCRSAAAAEQMSNTVQVQFKAATVHVYASNDMVSNSIAKSSGWETTEVEHVLWALQQTTPQQQQQQQQPPLFVDIGANVGVFSVSAAAAGARVAAFEAMPSNVALLRRSLCSTPWLAQKMALFGTGLGTKSAKCVIISDTVNRGDGHTVCDRDPQTAVMEAGWSNNHTYEVRGEMTVRRLDTLLAEDVQVMKIDVEGFELEVLQGAQGLLQQHNVWYIMAECNVGIIGRDGQHRFLRFLESMGYYISTHSFSGPFLPVDRIRSGKASIPEPELANLFCQRQQEQAAALPAGSAPSLVFTNCLANASADLLDSVAFPGNSSFEALSAAVWNTAYTATRTPAAVAQHTSAEQVSQLVLCAIAANLAFAVRGGSHSYEAMSLINSGLVIDLKRMDSMRLVPGSNAGSAGGAAGTVNGSNRASPRVLVGPGARVGPVYAFLSKHGRMLEGATCPSVGISGSTLVWDKVMLEVYCWCPEQQLQQLLATFPYAQAGLTAPNPTVLCSWNYSAYMLSSSVTNCYGAAQWGSDNISSTAAVTQAEQAWREAHTQGSWRFHGGSAVFMGAIPDDQLANFSTIAMDRISNPRSYTRAVMVAAGGLQRRMASNATGFGYRMMNQQLEIGTQARGAKDAVWVDAVLEALMPSSKGQRFYNHFQCLEEEQQPWTSYFGDNAAQLLDVKAQYEPQQRINGMSCAALN